MITSLPETNVEERDKAGTVSLRFKINGMLGHLLVLTAKVQSFAGFLSSRKASCTDMCAEGTQDLRLEPSRLDPSLEGCIVSGMSQ